MVAEKSSRGTHIKDSVLSVCDFIWLTVVENRMKINLQSGIWGVMNHVARNSFLPLEWSEVLNIVWIRSRALWGPVRNQYRNHALVLGLISHACACRALVVLNLTKYCLVTYGLKLSIIRDNSYYSVTSAFDPLLFMTEKYCTAEESFFLSFWFVRHSWEWKKFSRVTKLWNLSIAQNYPANKYICQDILNQLSVLH